MQRKMKRERQDELLSAYLDGQLDAGECARVEARLASEPALWAGLEALRRTVVLVRGLPPAALPRNFILPQTMAARSRSVSLVRPRRALRVEPQGKAWAAPFLTAVTAVAGLLFAVVLAGDLLLAGVGGRALAPAAPEVRAPQMLMAATPSGEGAVEQMGPVVETPASAPTEAVAAAEAAVSRGDEEAAETQPPAPLLGGGATEEATLAPSLAVAGTGALPTASPLPAEATVSAPTPNPTPVERAFAAPLAQPTATMAAEKTEGGVEPAPTPGRVTRATPEFPSCLWRVLEVALGLITVALGVLAIRAWRGR